MYLLKVLVLPYALKTTDLKRKFDKISKHSKNHMQDIFIVHINTSILSSPYDVYLL